MDCIAVLVDIDNPTIDTVILWAQNNRLVAYAYLDAKITARRPLAGPSFDESVAEVREAFDIQSARVTRIQTWIQVG